MIASLDGTVLTVAADSLVVGVGGVGVRVFCTAGTVARTVPSERLRLATSLVVREDSLTLYGFRTEEERVLFDLLLGASGIGPRTALAVLGTLTPAELRTAVAQGDTATLTSVPGIGPKGAQRLVVELRDRVGTVGAPLAAGGDAVTIPLATEPTGWQATIAETLVGLGWSAREAQSVVAGLAAERGTGPVGDGELPDLVRAAIALAGRRP